MPRKFIFPLILFTSILLSGCQFTDQLKSLVSTSQVKKAEGDWQKQGNIYTTTLLYESPGGREENPVSITLENGIITKIDFQVQTQIDASIRYQQQFAKELPAVIVGKKITGLQIDKLSGASLTTDAFNAALLKLSQQI